MFIIDPNPDLSIGKFSITVSVLMYLVSKEFSTLSFDQTVALQDVSPEPH